MVTPHLRRALLFLLLMAAPAAAQEQGETRPELPRDVADSVIAFYNRASTVHLSGETVLAAGAEMVGDVAVLDGPFTLGGRIRGSLLVINGDLHLLPEAEVEGGVTVVGGQITGTASVGGEIQAYPDPLRYRLVDDRLEYAGPARDALVSAGREFGFGRTDFAVAVRRGYNRVEGLPIAFGPRARLGHRNPTNLEAIAIYRSAPGLGLTGNRLGYSLRAEQYLGGRNITRFGVRLFNDIVPVEETGLSDRENSLSTFLLHEDFRDHYGRRGWGAFVRLARRGLPYDLLIDYRDERDRTLANTGAWTLFGDGSGWRPQPLVAEGTLRSISVSLGYDTRNDMIAPAAGWLVRGGIERGLGGSLALPVTTLAPGDVVERRDDSNADFTAGILDVHRYARLGPSSRMAVRFLAAGSIDGKPLPPQRQQTLGGEGSLPGYRPFAFDCHARVRTVHLGGDDLFPYYGCDRLLLLQFEYQAGLPLVRALGRRLGFRGDLGESLGWVFFFDSGRAWTDAHARDGRGGGQDAFAADVGLGIRIERIGLYWGLPLSGRGQGLNFFVRIGPRL